MVIIRCFQSCMRGKREFPGRDRGRLRILINTQSHVLKGLNALRQHHIWNLCGVATSRYEVTAGRPVTRKHPCLDQDECAPDWRQMGALEPELSRSFLPSVFDPKGISSDQVLQRFNYFSLVTLLDISAKTLL